MTTATVQPSLSHPSLATYMATYQPSQLSTPSTPPHQLTHYTPQRQSPPPILSPRTIPISRIPWLPPLELPAPAIRISSPFFTDHYATLHLPKQSRHVRSSIAEIRVAYTAHPIHRLSNRVLPRPYLRDRAKDALQALENVSQRREYDREYMMWHYPNAFEDWDEGGFQGAWKARRRDRRCSRIVEVENMGELISTIRRGSVKMETETLGCLRTAGVVEQRGGVRKRGREEIEKGDERGIKRFRVDGELGAKAPNFRVTEIQETPGEIGNVSWNA